MLPTPNKLPQTEEETVPQEEEIDMVGIYRTILRVVAHLEKSEYNGGNERQAEVLQHDDLPNPASADGISQG